MPSIEFTETCSLFVRLSFAENCSKAPLRLSLRERETQADWLQGRRPLALQQGSGRRRECLGGRFEGVDE